MDNTEENDWDWEGTAESMAAEMEADKTVPLFFTNAEICATPQAALAYTSEHAGFDFARYCVTKKLDMYQRIRVVNYIRAKGSSREETLANLSSDAPDCLKEGDDSYLQPVLPNDAMLQHAVVLGDMDDDEWSDDEGGGGGGGGERENDTSTDKSTTVAPSAPEAPTAREMALAKRLARATELLTAYGVSDVVDEEDDDDEEGVADNDTYYFDSYSHWGIHQEMLTDVVRTEAYQHAIEKNAAYFKGKTVLDIGCGTGILSMFAARAGAKKVVGIDMSTMAFKAMDNIRENGLEDIVEIIHGKVEDLGDRGAGGEGEEKDDGKKKMNKLSPLQPHSFDVILSEWMGYALTFECMLETVLKARDMWLKPGGLVLPNVAEIYVQGMGDLVDWKKAVGYWDDVYGFKMTTMKSLVLPEAHVFVVKKHSVVGKRDLLHTYDIGTVKPEDLDIKESKFQLCLSKEETTLTGLCISFDCDFKSDLLEHSVKLPTGPECTPTHWKQTVLYLPEPMILDCGKEDQHVVEGKLTIARNSQNPRNLDFVLIIGEKTYQYKMG